MRLIKSIIEKKKKKKRKMNAEENPCWEGYEMIGTKMKKGKEVPNCVPKKESRIGENNHKMKEYNDSIYSLSILHRKEDTTENATSKKSISIHENNTSLVDVLTTLSDYMYSIDAEYESINQTNDTTISIMTDDSNLNISLSKENMKWRSFEIAQVEAIFLNPAEKKYKEV